MNKLSLWLNAGERVCLYFDNCFDEIARTSVSHHNYCLRGFKVQLLICPSCGKSVTVEEGIKYKYCPFCSTINIPEMKEINK